MGLMKTIVCPKCGKEYSALRSCCPQCGARNQNPSSRSAATTDSARPGTDPARRAADEARFRMITGLCIVAAIIIAVIVLIVAMVNGNYSSAPVTTEEVTAAATPSPEVSVEPTPSPSPTPSVTAVAITFLGTQKTEFSMKKAETIQLKASVTPNTSTDEVEWTSSDEAVIGVSKDGLVTANGSGSATITCTCGGMSATCKVLVW